MEFISNSIRHYFNKIHDKTLTTSSALELLMDIREFKQIHESHIKEFKSFNGLSYDVILEALDQEIHRLEQSHIKYQSDHLLTVNTKQYTIDQSNKTTEVHLSNNTDQWLSSIQDIKVGIQDLKDNISEGVSEGIIKGTKQVQDELFVRNTKKQKQKVTRDSDDYLRDLQIAQQYAKKIKST